MTQKRTLSEVRPHRAFRRRLAGLRASEVQMQGAGYAVSQGLIVLFAGLSTIVVARALTTQSFGAQSFVISFVTFVALFFDFGLFLPAARMAAQSDVSDQAGIVGAAFIAFVPIGCLFSATVFGLSFFVDAWFHVHASQGLRIISGLTFVYPLYFVLNNLAQGVARLHIYSVMSAAAQGLYLVAVLVVPLFGARLTLSLVLELRLIALVATSVIQIIWLSPAFRGAVARVPDLIRHARDYGFQTYIGRLLSMATYNMDVLMLGVLTNASAVAYYSLAGSTAYVVSLPVYGLSAALFSRMTSGMRIDGRWLAFGWISGLGCALAVIAVSPFLIPRIFSSRYASAVPLIAPLAFAQMVRGVTTVYNTFLSAHGSGSALRKAATTLTVSNLVFNFVLIPPFGALGAAWASLAALAVNLGAHVVFYRRAFGTRAIASDPPAADAQISRAPR